MVTCRDHVIGRSRDHDITTSDKLEIVLALLTEVIAFYVQVTIVMIGVLGFERSIIIISSFDRYKWGCQGLVLDPLDTSPYKLLEKVIVWQS